MRYVSQPVRVAGLREGGARRAQPQPSGARFTLSQLATCFMYYLKSTWADEPNLSLQVHMMFELELSASHEVLP